MPEIDSRLLGADVWTPALEKYAGVTNLTISLYDRDARVVVGPINPTPLADLIAPSRFGADVLSQCVQRCLGRPPRGIEVTTRLGLAVIGAPLVVNDEVVGAIAAGYHLLEFPQSLALERLARDTEVPLARLWEVTRERAPVSKSRYMAEADLLRVLSDTLLKETYRTQQQAQLAAELQAANAAKDQFLAMVSHELRGPLNAMLGWIRLLRAETLNDTAREHALETIERNAWAQARLIEDLLDMSRILAGGMQIDRQQVALQPIVQAAIESVTPAADTKRVRLETTLQDVGSVAGDPNHLQQATLNLLTNALKFTPTGGEVSIRLVRHDGDAILSVTDTGDGIKPEFLPQVFEPFRQQDSTSTRAHGGLGLGLAITHHLITLHNGSIRAESPGVGQGATFTVTLPLIAAGSKTASAEHGVAKAQSLPELNGVRVLVVEDDADARELLQAVLERVGAHVTAVTCAAEALAVLDAMRPDVLLSDIGLPGEDGYTLIRHVRSRYGNFGRDLPAIAVTAWAGAPDRERAKAAGYDTHIPKPVDTPTLIRAVATLAN